MHWKLLAGLACSAALLLGACSSSPPAAGDGSPDSPNQGNNGNGNNVGGGGTTPDPLQAARAAVKAVTDAENVGDQALLNLIKTARDELQKAVDSALAAYNAARDSGVAADIGKAQRAWADALSFQASQTKELDRRQVSVAWFSRQIVRSAIPNGMVDIPADGTNTVTIERIPRTKNASATDTTTQVANTPDAFTSTTFDYVKYSVGKVLLSGSGRTTPPGVTEDEFKVDGDVVGMTPSLPLDTDTHTGLKLLSNGLQIRVGGTRGSSSDDEMTDYTDMRKDITAHVDDADADGTAETPRGQNAWDLKITFDEPKPGSGYRDVVVNSNTGERGLASWQGNGDFYWRGIVRAHDSQLESSGANYESDAFKQPKDPVDQRNLGTYEVWISNHFEYDQLVEPETPTVEIPSYPDDDVNRYLNYAAYGLFIYTADTETFRATTNGQENRVQSLSFGYQAFANEDGKKTRDISKGISGGTFVGQTLATVITGTQTAGTQKATLLRGKASLTVTIPKDSATLGTVKGTLSRFEEWAGTYWKEYKPNTAGAFSVRLDNGTAGTGANVSAAGSYNGVATATNAATGLGSSGVGTFKGNFYGPRTDTDLETAGSWNVGPGASGQDATATSIIVGSFGAKQKPKPASGN